MANEGLPRTQFPSPAELKANLGPALGDTYGLTYDRRTTQGKLAGRIYGDQTNEADQRQGFQTSGEFYNPTEYDISNTYVPEDVSDGAPAFTETDIPTSSTNYSRPRTVAAGYDAARKTMTVVFRDGTYYNYYEVEPGEWEAFHASYSKGAPWLNRGFANGKQKVDGLFINKPRGYVTDMSKIDPRVQQELYRVARTQQIIHKPKSGAGSIYYNQNPKGTAAGYREAWTESVTQAKSNLTGTPGKNPTRMGKAQGKSTTGRRRAS